MCQVRYCLCKGVSVQHMTLVVHHQGNACERGRCWPSKRQQRRITCEMYVAGSGSHAVVVMLTTRTVAMVCPQIDRYVAVGIMQEGGNLQTLVQSWTDDLDLRDSLFDKEWTVNPLLFLPPFPPDPERMYRLCFRNDAPSGDNSHSTVLSQPNPLYHPPSHSSCAAPAVMALLLSHGARQRTMVVHACVDMPCQCGQHQRVRDEQTLNQVCGFHLEPATA